MDRWAGSLINSSLISQFSITSHHCIVKVHHLCASRHMGCGTGWDGGGALIEKNAQICKQLQSLSKQFILGPNQSTVILRTPTRPSSLNFASRGLQDRTGVTAGVYWLKRMTKFTRKMTIPVETIFLETKPIESYFVHSNASVIVTHRVAWVIKRRGREGGDAFIKWSARICK